MAYEKGMRFVRIKRKDERKEPPILWYEIMSIRSKNQTECVPGENGVH